VVIARVTNRTLCLTPMEDGRTYARNSAEATAIEDIYDVEILGNFVQTIPTTECPRLDTCISTFGLCGRPPNVIYTDVVVSTEEYRRRTLRYGGGDWAGCLSPVRCGVGPEVPVELHREMWLHLRKPPYILQAAREWISGMFGTGHDASSPLNYLSLHWRFEEDVCPRSGHRVGECVWTMDGPVSMSHEDLVSSILTASVASGGIRRLFIATDGRRRDGDDLVDALHQTLVIHHGFDVKESRDWKCDAACWERIKMPKLSKEKKIDEMILGNFFSELEQQLVAFSSYAIGSSRSSWYFEALFDRASREGNNVAFNILMEVEMGMHAMSPDLHKQKNIPFPSVSAMDGMRFGFLGEPVNCNYQYSGTKGTKQKEVRATDGSSGICCQVNC